MNRIDHVPSGAGMRRLVSVLAIASLAALLFGIKLALIGSYGNATPYWDQWVGEANRYAPFLEGRLELAHILWPHNEHRSATSWLLAIGLLSVNGVWNPLLQMIVNAGLHVGSVCLLVNLMTKAAGDRFLPVGAGFCLMLFGLPYAYENTLWGFQSSFYFLLLFGVGSLWLVIGALPFSARWWSGMGLAVLAFFSLSSGVFAPAALAGVAALQYLLRIRTSKLHVASVLVLGGLFVLGVMLTPNIDAHSPLKATTATQLFGSWNDVMGWPLKVAVLGPLLRNAPALLFAALMIRTRPASGDPRWFLLTLVLWMFGQGLAVAYGRAVAPLASRYRDLFAIDVLTNFACLVALVENAARVHGAAVLLAVTWTATVLGCLGSGVHKHDLPTLRYWIESAKAQELNTKTYVLTGDPKHLEGKPERHVPYPEPDYLAAQLDNPTIRSVLPKNIGAPLKGVTDGSDFAETGTVDGYAPETPRPLAPAWGTYGAAGAATTGKLSVTFPVAHRGYRVEIPVAGDSRAEGIDLEVEQDGTRWRLVADGDGNETWGTATATVRGRPFTLHITDGNSEAWVAVGSPVAVGRWDGHVDRLLARWDAWVIVGAVMAVALMTFVGLATAEPVL